MLGRDLPISGGAVDTGDKNKFAIISAIFVKFRKGPTRILRDQGETDREKKSKILYQSEYKLFSFVCQNVVNI
jgi:hypothetical protein